MSSLTAKDLEKVQALLQSANIDYQLELEDGNIVVMGPSDIISTLTIPELFPGWELPISQLCPPVFD